MYEILPTFRIITFALGLTPLVYLPARIIFGNKFRRDVTDKETRDFERFGSSHHSAGLENYPDEKYKCNGI